MTAKQVVAIAVKYVGTWQNSLVHKAMIDRYNSVLPRPSGYKMTYQDAWCDAFVTAIADEAGVSALTGRECGVERHIKLMRSLGIWLGRVRPAVGDLVTFDWDGGGFADHIGWVAEVSGERFRTVEGNSNSKVAQHWFAWNDWRIKGFGRPKYKGAAGSSMPVTQKTVEDLAKEVLLGIWGNSPARSTALTQAGYDASAVQKRVNELLKGMSSGAGSISAGEVVMPKRVQVSKTASRFYTGEVLDAWVKGTTFDVMERRVQTDHVLTYLLGYQGGVIGWLAEGDVKVV
ncbi:CHAP domain-containing protein [Aerococcaceae bacterium WS4759]|uniref:CHAP domain-containing protein n=2 Tax=Fundicoccus ignavus TaxID=2664442 RepID=A0A6I2GJA9_9LACT|nr:CHAP domain-containing protein [Fundicoccus ignavus]